MTERLTRLIQIVSFPGVGPGATIALPHDININDVSVTPDFVAGDAGDFAISVTATTVTVTNNNSIVASINVWLERKHSIPRQLGGVPLSPSPFIAAGGGGGSLPPLVNIPGEAFISLGVGSHNDVDLWSGGPHISRVEVDLTGISATITGIVAGADGDLLYLWNGGNGGVGSPDILTLVNASPASEFLNRIWLADGKTLNIPNNDGVLLIYDSDFGWTVFGGATTSVRAQELSLDPVARPAALVNGSTNNDYNPFTPGAVCSCVFQDTGLAATVTGIVAAGAPNAEGRVLVFVNTSTTGTITFTNADAGSNPVNQLLLPGGVSLAIGPQGAVTFVYDLTIAIWRVQSHT